MKTATEAREILNESKEYLQSVLDETELEVISQAKKGLDWAHVNIKGGDGDSFVTRVHEELILLGYKTDGLNSAYNFTIKW